MQTGFSRTIRTNSTSRLLKERIRCVDRCFHTIFGTVDRLSMQEENEKVVETVIQPERIRSAEVADAVFRKERKRVFDFIRRRVGNEADAEDILEDVFYQLLSSYSVTEPIEKMMSWLFTVARNRIIDWYRKRKHLPLPVNEDDPYLPMNIPELTADPAANPEGLYARSSLWAELEEALADLPEEQRDVFVMNELEGKTFKEIAEKTGEPINTLLSRKRYAVLYLRERLQELYDEFDFV